MYIDIVHDNCVHYARTDGDDGGDVNDDCYCCFLNVADDLNDDDVDVDDDVFDVVAIGLELGQRSSLHQTARPTERFHGHSQTLN